MAIFKTGTGFSIELINWELVWRGKHNNLPLYESFGGQVTAIALVDEPAIGEKAMGNDSDRIITGPVMIPDLKMYRNMGLKVAIGIFQRKLLKNYNKVLKEK